MTAINDTKILVKKILIAILVFIVPGLIIVGGLLLTKHLLPSTYKADNKPVQVLN